MVILEIKDDGTLIYNGKVYVEVGKSAESTATETKESIFAGICKNLTRNADFEKYPNSVFWLDKDGKFMFEHDEKKGIFWCSYDRFWSFFESKLGMKYDEIQAFTKAMVEEHFKCKGITTGFTSGYNYVTVEEHFKCKGITTGDKRYPDSLEVEEHFKCSNKQQTK